MKEERKAEDAKTGRSDDGDRSERRLELDPCASRSTGGSLDKEG